MSSVVKINQPVESYSEIAKTFQQMEKYHYTRMSKKFDLCYVLAKENMVLRKYPPLLQLENVMGWMLEHII